MQTDYENLPGLHHIPDDDDNKPAQIPLASGEERTASSHRGEEQTSSERLFHPLLHNVMVSKIVAFAACDIAVAHRTACVTKQWETWIGNAPEKAALLFPAAMGYVLHRAILHDVPSLLVWVNVLAHNATMRLIRSPAVQESALASWVWAAIDMAPFLRASGAPGTTLRDRRHMWQSEFCSPEEEYGGGDSLLRQQYFRTTGDQSQQRHHQQQHGWKGVKTLMTIFSRECGPVTLSALQYAVSRQRFHIAKLLFALTFERDDDDDDDDPSWDVKRNKNKKKGAATSAAPSPLGALETSSLLSEAFHYSAHEGQTEMIQFFLRKQGRAHHPWLRIGRDNMRTAAREAYARKHYDVADLICKSQGWDETGAVRCSRSCCCVPCCPSCCHDCCASSTTPSFQEETTVPFSSVTDIDAAAWAILAACIIFLGFYVASIYLTAQGTTCCVPAACIKEGKNISGSIAPSLNFFASEDFSSSFWQTTTNGGLCSLNPEAAALASTSCTAAFKTLRNSCPSSSLVIEGGTCDAQSSGSIRTFLVVGSAFGLVPVCLYLIEWLAVMKKVKIGGEKFITCVHAFLMLFHLVSFSVLAVGVAKTNSLGGGPVAGSKSHIYVHADAPFDSLDAGGTCSEVASLLRVDILAPHARNLAIAGVTFSAIWFVIPCMFVCFMCMLLCSPPLFK